MSPSFALCRRYDQIASERELESAGDRGAVDRRQHRQRKFLKPDRQLRHRAHESDIAAGLSADRLIVFQVGARAEGAAAAGQYDGAQLRVGAAVVERRD